MSKRKYTDIKQYEAGILSKRALGETHREIAEYYGLEKAQIKKFLKRHREQQAELVEGKQLRPKGRPRKDGQSPHQSEQKEIERLRMENRLLRDFLQLTGRK